MEGDTKVLMSDRQGPLLFELRRIWPCRSGVSQHCPACAERRRRADHKPGSANCAPVNPRRDAQPPPSQFRGGEGTRPRVGGAGVPATARRSLPADAESSAIREPFCSHRQPRGAALAPHPSACVEQSNSRIDEATISSVFFFLKQSFSLSSCPLLS